MSPLKVYQLPLTSILQNEPATVGVKNKSECTQEMPQLQSNALPSHQKKKIWGTNTDNTNAIYEITDAQTKTCNRGTASERSVRNLRVCVSLRRRRFKNQLYSRKTSPLSPDAVKKKIQTER